MRATDHFRERSLGIVLRERQGNEVAPAGAQNITRDPLEGVMPAAVDAPPSVLQMMQNRPQPGFASPMPPSGPFTPMPPPADPLPAPRPINRLTPVPPTPGLMPTQWQNTPSDLPAGGSRLPQRPGS